MILNYSYSYQNHLMQISANLQSPISNLQSPSSFLSRNNSLHLRLLEPEQEWSFCSKCRCFLNTPTLRGTVRPEARIEGREGVTDCKHSHHIIIDCCCCNTSHVFLLPGHITTRPNAFPFSILQICTRFSRSQRSHLIVKAPSRPNISDSMFRSYLGSWLFLHLASLPVWLGRLLDGTASLRAVVDHTYQRG